MQYKYVNYNFFICPVIHSSSLLLVIGQIDLLVCHVENVSSGKEALFVATVI